MTMNTKETLTSKWNTFVSQLNQNEQGIIKQLLLSDTVVGDNELDELVAARLKEIEMDGDGNINCW